MPLTTFQSDVQVIGQVSMNSISLPQNCIGNTNVQTPSPASAGIAATKLIHLVTEHVSQKPGTAVVASTDLVHVVYGSSCTIQGVQVVTTSPPTSSDTVTIDVKSGSTSVAYTTILTAPIVLSSTTVSKTVYTATLATTTANAGDSFEVLVTTSGTSCQGLLVTLVLFESAS